MQTCVGKVLVCKVLVVHFRLVLKLECVLRLKVRLVCCSRYSLPAQQDVFAPSIGSKPTAPDDVPWLLGYRRAATYQVCCHEKPDVPRRVMCCCEVPGVRNICVLLWGSECVLAHYRVTVKVLVCGYMSCPTRICVTKSGRNIFPLQEYYSSALCTYCILCMLLWRHFLQSFCTRASQMKTFDFFFFYFWSWTVLVCWSMTHMQMCGYFVHCYAAIFLHDGFNCCIGPWYHYSVCLTRSRSVLQN